MTRQTHIEGVVETNTIHLADERGALDKFFHSQLQEICSTVPAWKQVLRSTTKQAGVLRGLQALRAPHTEGKLIVPLNGEMFWVSVDMRVGSETFGCWTSKTLRPDSGKGLFVARGFFHGCLSMTDDVELLIMADNDHSDAHNIGIRWDDPDLAIDWPTQGRQPILSAGHAGYPSFANFQSLHDGL
ncbi:MAG: dTDP-4-dehydrorhamnose 3,5-epimerase family protein [Alphaproteobacteria bacterium]|nr:dTDP-4-dehydrorhamnose 3,5-epimerase family protein [Alphaproteobacteria bacterium]